MADAIANAAFSTTPSGYVSRQDSAYTPSFKPGLLSAFAALPVFRDLSLTEPALKAAVMDLFVNDQKVIISIPRATAAVVRKPISKPAVMQPAAAARLDQIRSALGLSMTQMAELFGVTRKAVYDWYEGTEPRSFKLNRMDALIACMENLPQGADIGRLKATWKVPIAGQSFLDTFLDESLPTKELETALKAKLNDLLPRMARTTISSEEASSRGGPLASNNADIERFVDFG